MLTLVASACSSGSASSAVSAASASGSTSGNAFAGLGTWVDVYDYGPRFQSSATALPSVTPASVDDMARLGVKTLYLQAAQDDTRSEGNLVDRRLVGDILVRAHRRGVKVVAWYLPHFADVDRDLAHIRAMNDFRVQGERFDGIALDIEWTNDVKDAALRNRALIELAARTRRLVTRVPLGAIVLEPVLIEDVNPNYWPNFPWKALRRSFDVWLPMTYWTNRSTSSGWRDSFRYTSENVRRVRTDLGEPDAAVHAIGGIADRATTADYAGFVRAAIYGLPELYADQLPDARLVANPGCYPTSVILGLRPLVESGWIAQRARHRLRLQVRRIGRGQGTQARAALCRSGRKLPRLRTVFAPAHAGSHRSHGNQRRRHRLHDAPACRWLAAFYPRFTCGLPSRTRRKRSNRSTASFMRTAR